MNIIVFPGQGSQKIGMGKELSENFIEAKHVFEEVNDAINLNLTKIMWEGTDDQISLTSNAQPALMACSVAVLRVLEKITNKNLPNLADYLCGHSLGEYTAMTAAGVFSLKECAVLLRLRGNAMQESVPLGQGAMAAFIGVDIDTTQKILNEVQTIGICDVGNDNADGQVVISGDKSAVEKAIELSKGFGVKRAVILPVSAPFHCRLMSPAQLVMKEALSKINFCAPVVPIISNTTALPENDTDILKNNLVDQVTSTVRWRETMNFANELRVKKIIELGSGKVLTGIAKRMVKDVTAINIEVSTDFDQF